MTRERSAASRPPSALARRAILDAHARCDRIAALARDPVQFPRRYSDRLDREVVALVSALLAFGNVETIRAKLETLFARLGPSPGRAARDWSPTRLHRTLADYRHRTFRGADIARVLAAAGETARDVGSVYAPLVAAFERTHELRSALHAWTTLLRTRAWPRGADRFAQHLLPDPRGASACKRLALLCRWITRPDDGVDLGLVPLPTSALIVPLDVHVHRVARALGLTRRATASWAAAEEVTDALRALDADDPVRFDFAVCHVQIAARLDRRAEKRRATRAPVAGHRRGRPSY